jgi:hypothetical protein
MDYARIKGLALRMGIDALEDKDLKAYEPFSDGCSGRLSWVYGLMGKKISCHEACVAHDFLYAWGGGAADRKKADKLLRECVFYATAFLPGRWGRINRFLRCLRAWGMYGAVRLFAGRYWVWRADYPGRSG